ncbi:MAG: ROK family protein [Tissierellia bacterium]|nr:ROK family protein [Tissierellia bacterium]
MYLIFDIGGTSTKIGVVNRDSKIIKKYKIPKKNTLQEFLEMLEQEINYSIETYKIQGVGISCPGTVNTKTGEVMGQSALEYLHKYNFVNHLKNKYNFPIVIENDANCSALAELFFENPKEKLIAFVVIGTGIGGALIKDGEIIRGRRMESGEFGYMLLKNEDGEYRNFSRLATLPNVRSRIKEKYNINTTTYSILEKYFEKEEPYYSEVSQMYDYLCMGLYNIQYTYDPEVIYIGGGISQSDLFIEELKERLNQGIFKDADVQIRQVSFFNDNNILGAYANLLKLIEGERDVFDRS